MMRKLTIPTLTLCVGLLLPLFTSQAQTVSSFFLKARVESGGEVELAWTQPREDTVAFYTILRGPAMSEMMSLTAVDSTEDTTFTDHPPVEGTASYVYQVRARTTSGSFLFSNDAMVSLSHDTSQHDTVWITSEPPENARVGLEYRYQVRASSSDSSAILRFQLQHGPDGMHMDSLGLILWTPGIGQQGWHGVAIRVTSNKGGERYQEWMLHVSGKSGVVEGTVKDTAGVPISHVLIKLYYRNRDFHYVYRAVSDSIGSYRIEGVEVGTYLARAVPLRPDFLGQWYNGKTNPLEADPVIVADSTPTTINFILRSPFRAFPRFNVQGSVTDTAGSPVRGSMVVFVRAEFAFNDSKTPEGAMGEEDSYDVESFDEHEMVETQRDSDRRLDGDSRFVFKQQVDSAGRYSLILPAGFYIAFTHAPGYVRVFFNGKTDFLSADIIKIASDTVGIDFALKPIPPVALGEISGSVIDSVGGSPVRARLIAFRDHWSGGPRDYPDSYFADTDSLGKYELVNLAPGKYYILAVPLGPYVPSFYSVSGVTLSWRSATGIDINGTSVAGIDIYVRRRATEFASGYTSIAGKVLADAILGKATVGAGSAPLSGALVQASINGLTAGYALTTSDGSYLIRSLAPGTYSVSVVKPGYSEGSSTASPTYDSAGNPVTATSSFTLSGVTSVSAPPAPLPSGYALEQNYPNPFNPSTQIVFSIPNDGRVSLVVYNLLGQRIATLMDGQLLAGTHVATWASRDDFGNPIPSGVYFYQIHAKGFTATRKMVLLK